MKIKYKDMEIPKDSFLTVIGEIVNQKTKVLVRCKCGHEYYLNPQAIFRKDNVKMCSYCHSKSKIKAYREIGGIRKHGAYNILDAIKQRCYNKNSKAYIYYGAKGISVCDEWLNSYESFCLWADNNGYKDGLTIDRINVNGNYEPNNCRFVTKKEQRENKHIQANNSSGYAGVSFQKNTNKWFAYYWYDGKRYNCGYHDTPEKAYTARTSELAYKNIKYTRINNE